MRTAFERTTQLMTAAGVDALLLTPGADLFYLTGFEHGHAGERLLALVLHRDGGAQWIAPSMNVPQVEAKAMAGETLIGWSDSEGYRSALRQAIGQAGTVAFDDEARSAFLMDLLTILPGVHLRPASTILRALRIRKTPEELRILRRAAEQVDDTIAEAMTLCRPGRTEAQIDVALREALLRRGEAVAFTIVASGPNSALPHHETGNRPLQSGDIVVLDFGTRQDGYHSDITVTCSVGEPADPEARRVYRVVWEAQQAALRAVRPGATCAQIDSAARSVIEAAGYGPFFLHRTGHGLGLQIHEPPFLTPVSNEILEEGMAFSIEPGIYLAGRFGVRLEVIATVTADGGALINALSAPELPVI